MFEWLLSEWFWCPPGYTWKDLQPKDTNDHRRKFEDIFIYPFVIAIGLFAIRNFLINFVFAPVGKLLKVRSKPYKHPPPNRRLDELYSINRARPPQRKLLEFAKKLDWPTRRVERWLRQKALSQQMTTLEKFCDWGWLFIYYTSYCIFGLIVIRSKDWYINIFSILDNLPHHQITNDVWWYYMIPCGFYILQTILFLHQDRKGDFYVMFTHHVCTLLILYSCWMMGSFRICSVSLLFHECADIPLAVYKLFIYTKRNDLSNACTIPFLTLWFATRLYLYPRYILGIIYSSYGELGHGWPAYTFQLVVSTVLFIVHLLWTKEMCHGIFFKLFMAETIVDTRSSGEEMSESDECEVRPCMDRIKKSERQDENLLLLSTANSSLMKG